jgi:hypothetical protein
LLTTDVDALRRVIESQGSQQGLLLVPAASPSGGAAGIFVSDPDGHELFIRTK